MNDSAPSILPTVDAHIYPRGALDVLSRDEPLPLAARERHECFTAQIPLK